MIANVLTHALSRIFNLGETGEGDFYLLEKFPGFRGWNKSSHLSAEKGEADVFLKP